MENEDEGSDENSRQCHSFSREFKLKVVNYYYASMKNNLQTAKFHLDRKQVWNNWVKDREKISVQKRAKQILNETNAEHNFKFPN